MTGLRARLVAALVAIAFVVAVLLLGPAACNRIRSLSAQNKVTQGQLDASGKSGADAVATVGSAAERERQSDNLSRTNEGEIRNAQGADQKVDPAVRDAGLRSLCRRPAYRDSARCKLLEPAAR